MQGSAGFYEQEALGALRLTEGSSDANWAQVHALEANTYAMLALASSSEESRLMERS